MQNKKIKNFITAAAFGTLLVVASIMAYFTGSDAVTNRLKAISLDITLTETKWKPPTDTVLPDEVLEKNPQVTNNGEADAFVFLRVRVPYVVNTAMDCSGGEDIGNGKTAEKGEQRPRVENQPMPLFKFVVTTKDSNSNEVDTYDKELTSEQVVHDERWTLLTGYPFADKTNMELVYVYAYTEKGDSGTLTATKKGDPATVALFDKIRLVNYGSEHLADNVNGVLVVNVDAFAIQASDLGDGLTTANPLGVWNFLKQQQDKSGVNGV